VKLSQNCIKSTTKLHIITQNKETQHNTKFIFITHKIYFTSPQKIIVPATHLKCVTGYAEMSNYLPDHTIRDKTKGNESDWFIIISPTLNYLFSFNAIKKLFSSLFSLTLSSPFYILKIYFNILKVFVI